MGTPIDIEGDYEEGNPCTRCWGPGKPFGDVPTPKYMVLNVSGVFPCPPNEKNPPNGSWLLTQAEGFPCAWNLTTSNYIMGFGFGVDFTECWIRDIPSDKFWFRGLPEPVCTTFNKNWWSECTPGLFAAGGVVKIGYIKHPIAQKLLLENNLNKQDGTFMQNWLLENGIEVARYANLQTPMCVYVKFDSNLAEMHLEPFGPG